MKKNKSVININKVARRINYQMNEEIDVLKKIDILKENIKCFDNKLSGQILKKIIKIHQELLKQIGTKMEFYQLMENDLSYYSSEIAFKKENDLLTRLKAEETYFTMANQGINKMIRRYPKPILKLSNQEQQLLCDLTKDDKLFDFYELKGIDKIARLEQVKIEIMIPLKQVRRFIKQLKIKEKNNQDISNQEIDKKEEAYLIKKLCNYFIQYIDLVAIYEHYQIKKQENQNKKAVDDYVLTKENKEKLKYFITENENIMTKEDLIFCFQYILYKGSISNMLPLLYSRKDTLFSKLDEKETVKILNGFLDIIKYRKCKLDKNSIDRKLLKSLEEEYKKQIRLYKKNEENEEEKWCHLLNKNNVKSLNMFCEAIKSNPNGIFLKQRNKTYFEILLENYFNFILNKKKGFSKEEEIKYNNEKKYYEKILLTTLHELKYETKGDYLKIMIEYYYNHFLLISDKNDLSIEHKQYVLTCLKNLLDVFKEDLSNKENKIKKDLSNHYIMTIDSDSTKICEDAFSILEKDNTIECVLYVMDVVHLYPFDEELEHKFLTNQRIISKAQKKMLSLHQGRKKDAIAYIFELDKNDLKVLDFKVQKEQIMVNKNYTFTEVNELLINNEGKNKEKIDNVVNFLKKVDIDDFKINLNEASSILESLIIFFQTMYCQECEKVSYPVLYSNFEFLSDEEEHLYYSSYCLGKLRLSLTSPVRKFDSYLNQLLSVWYFVQGKIESPNDLEKACKFVDEYVEILNKKQSVKYKQKEIG